MWVSVRQINVKWHNLQKSCPVCWVSPLHCSLRKVKRLTWQPVFSNFPMARSLGALSEVSCFCFCNCPERLVCPTFTYSSVVVLAPLMCPEVSHWLTFDLVGTPCPRNLFFLPDLSEQGPRGRFLSHGKPGTPMRNANAKVEHWCLATCFTGEWSVSFTFVSSPVNTLVMVNPRGECGGQDSSRSHLQVVASVGWNIYSGFCWTVAGCWSSTITPLRVPAFMSVCSSLLSWTCISSCCYQLLMSSSSLRGNTFSGHCCTISRYKTFRKNSIL